MDFINDGMELVSSYGTAGWLGLAVATLVLLNLIRRVINYNPHVSAPSHLAYFTSRFHVLELLDLVEPAVYGVAGGFRRRRTSRTAFPGSETSWHSEKSLWISCLTRTRRWGPSPFTYRHGHVVFPCP